MGTWIVYAPLSALAAGATALSTAVVLVFAWGIVLAWLTPGEPVSPRLAAGIRLMVVGAIVTVGA